MKNIIKISSLFLFWSTLGGLIQAHGHSPKTNLDNAKTSINRGEGNKSEVQVKSIVLPGVLTFDPNGYMEIHPSQIGRVIIDPHNPMPQTGAIIEKGQVIAVLEDLIPKADDTSKRTDLQNIEADIEKHTREIKRLKTLGIYSAKKDLENRETDLQKAQRQRETILNMLGKEFIRALMGGIVNLFCSPGQVFKPEERMLAEIIKPGYARVIVSADYSPSLKHITKAFLRIPTQLQTEYPLKLVGFVPKLDKGQKQAIIFDLLSPNPDLIIGMDMEV